ncbi:membrane-spanning 4-domains subfamily A member 4A-like protein [Labeo rohita]|uniref:Membrane-spanning 4-domains subfamily A member 4A-like protein n=1 Tax=Labeo rohita TaxID=84645 RepID=A0A498L8U2_LABRO|nr:membrane-spanning 4-domains subfamily A member 4A-like protein [Labeo rohita]
MSGITIFSLGVFLTINVDFPNIVVISGLTYWGSLIYIAAGSLSVAAQNKRHLRLIVQIMSGITIFSLGVFLTINVEFPNIVVISGLTYWGSLIYIAAGSLSVAAQNKRHLRLGPILRPAGIILLFTISQFIISICVSALACKATCNIQSTVVKVALNQVKASLGMNVFSATTATIAILLMGLDFFNPLPPYHCSYHYYGDDDCVISKGFVLGIIILLLVFSSLQFIISICIAAFACKATSNNNSTVVSVELNQSLVY